MSGHFLSYFNGNLHLENCYNDRCLLQQPLIIYYMREKCFRNAINTAVKNLKLYKNDPVLRFFKAFATLMEGRLKCDFIYIIMNKGSKRGEIP